MRLLLGATAAMLSPIYELGSALLSVVSQVHGGRRMLNGLG